MLMHATVPCSVPTMSRSSSGQESANEVMPTATGTGDCLVEVSASSILVKNSKGSRGDIDQKMMHASLSEETMSGAVSKYLTQEAGAFASEPSGSLDPSRAVC
mmetsp:Transcript_113488/g.206926  ORF Transcript_113488/g.206926 Transcript_113488/m.206926 type:complete len:103 (-) Transcript_113488:2035-2343(-)